MPKAEAEGVLFIEESVSDAMSDTTLDCKLSKADVSGHIGTGGLRKAQASYRQARLDVQTKLASALSARREAERSYLAAENSLVDAEQVSALTEAQYSAGRKDLDSVDHARMDRDAAEAELEKLASTRAFARWQAALALFPHQFPTAMMRQLHLEVRLPTGSEHR
jgi:hypothetical protein